MKTTWLAVACVALGWSVPFVYPYAGEPLSSFYNDVLAMGFGLGACAILFVRSGPLLFPRALIAPFGLIVLILVQMLLGWLPYPQWALVAANYLLWACAMMMAGARLREECGTARLAVPLAWALVIGGVLNAAVSVAQAAGYLLPFWLALPNLGHSVFGNLAQTNHLADYSALALASAIFLFVLGRLVLAGLLLLLLPLLLTLAATGSRSAWLYMGALLLLALWLRRGLPAREATRLLTACAMTLPCLGAAALLLTELRDLLPGAAVTAVTRLSAQTFAADPRLDLWREALQIFAAHPIMGVGQGNFTLQHFLMNGDHGRPSYSDVFENAHNLLLQIGAEFGLIGLALLGVALRLWIGRARAPEVSVERWWWSAILAVIALHSMLEYPLWYGHFLGVAALAAGVLDAAPWRVDVVAVRMRIWAGMIVATGLCILAINVTDYRKLEAFLRSRAQLSAGEQSTSAVTELLQLRNRSLMAPLVDFGLTRTIRYEPAVLNANLELNGRVMRLWPVWDVVYRQAILLAMDGKTAAAVTIWRQAQRGFPQQHAQFFALLERLAEDGVTGTAALKQALRERTEKEQ